MAVHRVGDSEQNIENFSNIVLCALCGTPGHREDKSCSCCGGPLSLSCDACGSSARQMTANYCHVCGSPLSRSGNGSKWWN